MDARRDGVGKTSRIRLDLMTKLQRADTLVRERSLEEPTHFSVDEQSNVEFELMRD